MLLLLVITVALIFRILPLKLWQIEGSDAWSHILDSKLIEKNNGKLPEKLDQFFPQPEFTYPWAISWLLYKCKPKSPVIFGVWVNIIFSMFEMLIAGLVTWYLGNHLPNLSGESVYYAVILTLGVYAVSPLVVSPWAGVYGVNARVFGALATNVALTTLAIGMSAQLPWLLLVPAFLTVLIILSSQFAVQAMILGVTILSLAFSSFVPFAVLLIGISAALILTRGKAYSILKGHFYHVKFYFKHLQYHNVGTVHRTWGLVRWIKQAINSRKIAATIKSMVWVPIIRVFIWNPWLFILLASGIIKPKSFADLEIIWLIFAGLIVVPIITMKHIRFLGEPDRYFTFISTMPLAILVGLFVAQINELVPLYFFVLLGSLIASILMIKENSNIERDQGAHNEIQVAKKLDELTSQKDIRVLVVPQNISDKIACYCSSTFTGIHTNVTCDESQWRYYYKLFKKFYPYPSVDEKELKETFSVGYIVIAKRFISDQYLSRHYLSRNEVLTEPEGNFIYQNSQYLIFKI